jgi:hypothetical protein
VIFGVGVEQVCRNRGLNHMAHDVCAQSFVVNGISMLRGDHNGVNATRLVVCTIFNCDL